MVYVDFCCSSAKPLYHRFYMVTVGDNDLFITHMESLSRDLLRDAVIEGRNNNINSLEWIDHTPTNNTPNLDGQITTQHSHLFSMFYKEVFGGRPRVTDALVLE